MRRLGVLVGTTGRGSNVLKIRPPLALDEGHVPQLVGALERALLGNCEHTAPSPSGRGWSFVLASGVVEVDFHAPNPTVMLLRCVKLSSAP